MKQFLIKTEKESLFKDKKVSGPYLLLRKRNIIILIIVILVISFISYNHFRNLSAQSPVITSCEKDQPLVKVFSNYLVEPDFEQIKNDALETVRDSSLEGQDLSQDNFKYTRGWMLKFNADGFEYFRRNPKFAWTLPYVNQVLNHRANAFVLNLVIASPPPVGINAVGTHVDDTVGIMSSYEFLAHQVNVLYVSLPKGFNGGEIEVWPNADENTEYNKARVTPLENMMVEFRGDAFHKVKGFTSIDNKERISLVFEQYQIDEEFYPYTIQYCANKECMDDAKY